MKGIKKKGRLITVAQLPNQHSFCSEVSRGDVPWLFICSHLPHHLSLWTRPDNGQPPLGWKHWRHQMETLRGQVIHNGQIRQFFAGTLCRKSSKQKNCIFRGVSNSNKDCTTPSLILASFEVPSSAHRKKVQLMSISRNVKVLCNRLGLGPLGNEIKRTPQPTMLARINNGKFRSHQLCQKSKMLSGSTLREPY